MRLVIPFNVCFRNFLHVLGTYYYKLYLPCAFHRFRGCKCFDEGQETLNTNHNILFIDHISNFSNALCSIFSMNFGVQSLVNCIFATVDVIISLLSFMGSTSPQMYFPHLQLRSKACQIYYTIVFAKWKTLSIF